MTLPFSGNFPNGSVAMTGCIFTRVQPGKAPFTGEITSLGRAAVPPEPQIETSAGRSCCSVCCPQRYRMYAYQPRRTGCFLNVFSRWSR
jgi:hypothetical protein